MRGRPWGGGAPAWVRRQYPQPPPEEIATILAAVLAEAEARHLLRTTCTLPDCDRPHRAKGYCDRHYQRWLKHGDPYGSTPRRPRPRRTCTLPGCDEPHAAKGYCGRHYQRWRRHGDPYGRSQARQEAR